MRIFNLNIWQLMMKMDGLVLTILNFIFLLKEFFNLKQRKLLKLNLQDIGKGRDLFIVLNGLYLQHV